MKKSLLMILSFWLFAHITPVFAESQSTAGPTVLELERQIEEKEAELDALKAQLQELKGDSQTQGDSELIGQTFEHEGIEITLDAVYLTDERYEYSDDEYDHVLVVEYTVLNNTDEQYSTGYELSLFVDGVKADEYYLSDNKSDSISKNRKSATHVSFAFNGELENMELEFANWYSWDADPIIIPLTDIETR